MQLVYLPQKRLSRVVRMSVLVCTSKLFFVFSFVVITVYIIEQ
nr:MAG TPA: hypothetical protein [Caudoviricetes sp.]